MTARIEVRVFDEKSIDQPVGLYVLNLSDEQIVKGLRHFETEESPRQIARVACHYYDILYNGKEETTS